MTRRLRMANERSTIMSSRLDNNFGIDRTMLRRDILAACINGRVPPVRGRTKLVLSAILSARVSQRRNIYARRDSLAPVALSVDAERICVLFPASPFLPPPSRPLVTLSVSFSVKCRDRQTPSPISVTPERIIVSQREIPLTSRKNKYFLCSGFLV